MPWHIFIVSLPGLLTSFLATFRRVLWLWETVPVNVRTVTIKQATNNFIVAVLDSWCGGGLNRLLLRPSICDSLVLQNPDLYSPVFRAPGCGSVIRDGLGLTEAKGLNQPP